MTDKDKIKQILGCDICTDRVKCKYDLQRHNRYYCNIFYVIESAIKWKEEQIFGMLEKLGYESALTALKQLMSANRMGE